MVESLVARVARRHGLSHAALNALAVIEGSGGPLPAGEVGARMHITSGTTTGVLDTLERNDHIRRLVDPGDRRRVLVDVTPAAREVLDRALPEVAQVCAVAVGALDDKEVRVLLDALAVVRAAVSGAPDDLPPPEPRRRPS